ncbi:hypothetical protein GPECTOR_7g1274 [Gonium pectorale]|uniref:Uncharacterized protein n=1 Tax=Gonium pectorale TaxID=33097 RepID=A0A150GUL0_GONPE|nr:hypothetical protein GPECTOR_7g1274 [Gonium pectorale]|eukprot:KXZ53378.1 hypothetical protein GPECTOR_7g1274 [Gonium pectorale]
MEQHQALLLLLPPPAQHLEPHQALALAPQLLQPQQQPQQQALQQRGRQCQTEGCTAVLLKAKGKYCSRDCYVRGCEALGEEPQRCQGFSGSCTNIAVPGEQGGKRCPDCHRAHKAADRARQSGQGRTCAWRDCGKVVRGTKPQYGKYCSLECGEASGTARPCEACGVPAAFSGSQDPRLCLQCYNASQLPRAAAIRRKKAEVQGLGGAKRRRGRRGKKVKEEDHDEEEESGDGGE